MPVMSQPPKKLTYADFLPFPDDGKRHELIDGVHDVTPSPRIPHQVLARRSEELPRIDLPAIR